MFLKTNSTKFKKRSKLPFLSEIAISAPVHSGKYGPPKPTQIKMLQEKDGYSKRYSEKWKNPEKKFYFFSVKRHKIAKYAKIAIFGRNLTKIGENHCWVKQWTDQEQFFEKIKNWALCAVRVKFSENASSTMKGRF